ncbi:Uncharacterised protein [Phocoenobacter uteri]|uniref:Uncharacterized protein n=1 Tax=Phocoenobacter uteri TaxID=146806 RepID=A0A379CAA1_9PAST|nr:Uncharacterised protein [Phocoenobacter uteri]
MLRKMLCCHNGKGGRVSADVYFIEGNQMRTKLDSKDDVCSIDVYVKFQKTKLLSQAGSYKLEFKHH